MRFLLLSDIHSNIEALGACIELARNVGYDSVLCCGDIVGYGPDPNAAVDLVRDLNCLSIRGNHDRVASGLDTAESFNHHARRAIEWTAAELTEGNRRFLRDLPVGPLVVSEDAQLVHGAATDEDDYIFTDEDADENFRIVNRRITFFGHSHFQVVYSFDLAQEAEIAMGVEEGAFLSVWLREDRQFLVNPGSVGQPRDGDRRASFAVWDVEKQRVELYRADYPVEAVQEKMRNARLPNYLIDRLSYGR